MEEARRKIGRQFGFHLFCLSLGEKFSSAFKKNHNNENVKTKIIIAASYGELAKH